MQPTQFRMNVSTGAPPDMFATLGQNWGFPTYQWSEMEKDGYAFWRRRLGHMSQCVLSLLCCATMQKGWSVCQCALL